MRRININLASLTMGSAMLIMCGAAMAGPPVPYGAYTVDGAGNITAPCPAGSTCSAPVAGANFLQRTLAVGGVTYFQTIILDPGNGFKDENFVQQGGNTGIADQQGIDTITSGVAFKSASNLNIGWAKGATDNLVTITQSLDNRINPGDTKQFVLNFSVINNDPLSTTADKVNIDQTVALNPTVASSIDTEKQLFQLQQLKAPSTIAKPPGATPALPNGQTIGWTAGDVIQAVWLGQAVNVGTDLQKFGFQGMNDLTAGHLDSASYSDLTADRKSVV